MGVRKKRIAIGSALAGAVALVGAQVGLPARAATANVQPGIATAGGALLGVIPGVSGLTLTTTYGEARAAYEETQAEATSATVDLGGLGYFLANEPTCGNTFPEKDQPQPLTANSGGGNASHTSGYGSAAAEEVSVSQSPEKAQATTSLVSETITGILAVTGQSVAAVHYLDGTEQEADAVVTENVELLGGMVEMKGMSWTASWHSGATNADIGNFSPGQVAINHIPVGGPNMSTAATFSAVNQAIGLLGFTVTPPAPSSDSSSVTVPPLVIRFSGSQVERTAINPAVGAVTQLEALLNSKAQAGQDCTKLPQLLYNLSNNADSEINLTLAITQGAGSLNFALGGANAGVENLPNFIDPFGSDNPLAATGGSLPATGSISSPVVTSNPAGGTVASAGSSLPAIGTARGPTASTGSAAVTTPAAVLASCRTTSPAGSPGCWRGVATVAALVLLAGGSGLFAADLVYGRRRRRRRPSLEERRAAL
jgi:hypothetical protein